VYFIIRFFNYLETNKNNSN